MARQRTGWGDDEVLAAAVVSEMNTVEAESGSGLRGVLAAEIRNSRSGHRAEIRATSLKRNPLKNLMRNLNRVTLTYPARTYPTRRHHSFPDLFWTFLKTDRPSGSRSAGWEAHRAECSPSRFGRYPYQSSLATVGPASSEAVGDSR